MKRKADFILERFGDDGFIVYSDYNAEFFVAIEGVRNAFDAAGAATFVLVDPRYDEDDVKGEIVRQLQAAILLDREN